jgi:hypothetical protein
VLVPVQLLDRLLNLFLVLQHRAELLFEARLTLLNAVNESSTLGRLEAGMASSTHVSNTFITFWFTIFFIPC